MGMIRVVLALLALTCAAQAECLPSIEAARHGNRHISVRWRAPNCYYALAGRGRKEVMRIDPAKRPEISSVARPMNAPASAGYEEQRQRLIGILRPFQGRGHVPAFTERFGWVD